MTFRLLRRSKRRWTFHCVLIEQSKGRKPTLSFISGTTNLVVSMLGINDCELSENRNSRVVRRESVRNDQQISGALEVEANQARLRRHLNLRIRTRCIGVADIYILRIALELIRVDW